MISQEKKKRVAVEQKVFEIEEVFRTQHPDEDYGLMGGQAGVALFYYNLFLYTQDAKYLSHITPILERVVSSINTGPLQYSLCNGLAGVNHLLCLLQKADLVGKDTIKEIVEPIDNYLKSSLARQSQLGNFDFLHGAGGVMWYFLHREGTDPLLPALFLRHIQAKACFLDQNRIAWRSSVTDRDNRPVKVYNLGLSHGMASTITILSKFLKSGIQPDVVEPLLIGSVRFILSSKLNHTYSSTFPSWIAEGDSVSRSRLAWCYGDLGISSALWQAGEALQDETIKQQAIEICLKTTKRKTLQEAGVLDAGFCHGTAGIAHIYRRMYLQTGGGDFKQAADFWVDRTLEMANSQGGYAGYLSWYGGIGKAKLNLLDGVAGIGLVLISHLSETEPGWDNCLLLSS